MISSKCGLRLAVVTLFFVMASLVAAQDYRGKVQGSVTDENGGAIPGAHVVLRNTKTGVEVNRAADNDGHYIFDFVDPGDYVVVVEQTGFKKAVQENVIVRVRVDISVNLKLAGGGGEAPGYVQAPPLSGQLASCTTFGHLSDRTRDQLPRRA